MKIIVKVDFRSESTPLKQEHVFDSEVAALGGLIYNLSKDLFPKFTFDDMGKVIFAVSTDMNFMAQYGYLEHETRVAAGPSFDDVLIVSFIVEES